MFNRFARVCTFVLAVVTSSLLGTPAVAVPPNSDDLPDQPIVSTLAGSGRLGFADGPASQASFVSPVDVSFADDGTLYVADREAQRIRAISPAGIVRTIAGSGSMTSLGLSVQGGYRDGPALQAQFDFPESVLAMPDGSVLVADRKNFVIRSIRNGMVTTFAGRHAQYGSTDGERTTALFRNPRSLARAPDGSIYVSDWGNGVRRIDPSGRVSTVRFSDTANIVSLSIPRSHPDVLITASSSQLEIFDLKTMERRALVSLDSEWSFEAGRDAGHPIGPIAGMVAYDPSRFLTVDALDSAVRFVVVDATSIKLSYIRTLGAPPDEDAPNGSEGFADGGNATAKFNQPTGIALSADGRIAVADLGNRRVRLISEFDRKVHIDVDLGANELPETPDARIRRIALVGNSDIWFGQAWHESIPGTIQDRLNVVKPFGIKTTRVYPIMRYGLFPLASLNLIGETLSTGVVDTVVLDLSTYGEFISESDANAAFAPGFDVSLRDGLKTLNQEMRDAKIQLLVVFHPGPADFPDELVYRRLEKGSPEFGGDTSPYRDAGQVQAMHDLISSAVMQSGAPYLDLWPAFISAYGASNRRALFNSWDHHMTAAGRQIVSENVAQRLAIMGVAADGPAVR